MVGLTSSIAVAFSLMAAIKMSQATIPSFRMKMRIFFSLRSSAAGGDASENRRKNPAEWEHPRIVYLELRAKSYLGKNDLNFWTFDHL